jgi:transposase-like protein
MSKRNHTEKNESGNMTETGKVVESTIRRWSAKRRMELVLQLLRGESLDSVSRKSGVALHQLSEWRDKFLVGAEAALKTRVEEFGDDSEKAALFAKIGEITMANELLEIKINKLETGLPFRLRR